GNLFARLPEGSNLCGDARMRGGSSSPVARLSESLERATSVPERCRRAVALLAAELAGFAAVDLQVEDGSMQRVASSRRDNWPVPDPGGDHELALRALASGRP